MSQQTDDDVNDVVVAEVPNASALEVITKAEIDTAIATAKAYPRELAAVRRDVLFLAAADQETAESCFFALPAKDENGKEITIDGESIRLAEIVASTWGNLKWGKRILNIDRVNKRVTSQGSVLDMEKNTFAQVEETKNILTKRGVIYSEHMITMTGKAAASIALRNAIFQIIPKVFFLAIMREIKDVAAGRKPGYMLTEKERKEWKAEPLDVRVGKAFKFFNNWGITSERIFASLGVKNIEAVTEDHLIKLTGIKSGVNQGEVKLDDAFPLTEADQNKKVGAEILDKAKNKGKKPEDNPAHIPQEDQA